MTKLNTREKINKSKNKLKFTSPFPSGTVFP